MVATGQKLVNQNPGIFQNSDLLVSSTSIDSLSPDSPLFPAMLRSPRAPWVSFHNIVGMVPTKRWFSEDELKGDGVVEYASAHMDDVVSEIVVDSEHQSIHRNPKAILEVRRILLEHLRSVESEYRVAQRLAARNRAMPAAQAVPRVNIATSPLRQPVHVQPATALQPVVPTSSFGVFETQPQVSTAGVELPSLLLPQ